MKKAIVREQTRAFVVLPIVLLVGAAIFALITALFFSARESNSLALAKQREFLGHAFEQHGYTLARELKVQAVWMEAYERTKALDHTWMHTYLGAYLDRLLGYGTLFVLSGSNEPVYAYAHGATAPVASFAPLSADLADLIAAVRGRDDKLQHYPVIMCKITFDDNTVVEHRAISDVRLIDGKPAQVVVTTIVPDAPNAETKTHPPFLIIAAAALDDAALATLGKRAGFEQLHWSTGSKRGMAANTIRALNGAPVGEIAWKKDEPGFALVRSMAGGLAIAFMLLIAFATILVRRGMNQAALIVEHSTQLTNLNESLEQRVLERTQELEATLGNISQGILMLGPDDQVVVCNPRAAELLEAVPEAGLEAVLPLLLAPSLAHREMQAGEQRWKAPRFDCTLASGRILEVARATLATGGQVLTLTDVTVLKRRQAELEAATLAATAANQTKTQFLSTMSHEMRTPLNGVIGALDLLNCTSLDAEQKRLVETALVSGEALLVHINDVLDFSKLEAGKLELETAPFEIYQLVETVLRIVEPQAAARDTKLASKIETAVPNVLIADAVRLRQILLNLAGNASKFTHAGLVSVGVTRIGGTDDVPELEFSVTDTGPGIPDHLISSMFQEFSMLDTSLARREGGTGLGLAICKRLVTAMGGTIGVESKLGHGSRFWFRLALARGAEIVPETAVSTPPQPQAIEKLKILLVDDSTVNRMIGTQMLTAAGHAIETATNGLEAVACGSATRYDVILMDISMPEMDGLEASRMIRLLAEPFGSVPIVALTANAVAGDRERFLAAGMNEYLTKPYRRADIERVLAALGPAARKAA
ncbi:MAG: ATP-binding protein [Hyphomicrobium sp.]|jgi:signal transduction histidine kinase/CheY-like chemotaxis protein